MLFDREMFERADCTREEKIRAVELIDLMLELSEQARRDGLLSLEKTPIPDDLLRRGISHVCDGVDPGIVKELLLTKVLSRRLSGEALLEAMIVIDGVLMIQGGSNPSLLYDKLMAYLGDDADLSAMWREGDRLGDEAFL